MARPHLIPFQQEEEEQIKTVDLNSIMPSNAPLLLLLGELDGEKSHAFFNPIKFTFENVDFPELESQSECLASRYGWLLILSRIKSSLFFFNPFTREKINLPYRHNVFNAVTFSGSPTDPNCVVYAVETPAFLGQLCVDTLRVGQERWYHHVYICYPKDFTNVVQAVCSNEVVYCVDSRGRVGVFDETKNVWSVVSNSQGFGRRVSVPYLVESKGVIYAAEKGYLGEIEKVHKLRSEEGVAFWEEVNDFGEATFFLGPYGSHAMLGLKNGWNKQKLFVADYKPQSKCVAYKKEGFDYKKDMNLNTELYNWWYTPVWVEISS